MTATAVASCPCIPDEVFCAWPGCKNKLNWVQAWNGTCGVFSPRARLGGCKGKVQARGTPWLATSTAFTTKAPPSRRPRVITKSSIMEVNPKSRAALILQYKQVKIHFHAIYWIAIVIATRWWNLSSSQVYIRTFCWVSLAWNFNRWFYPLA